MEKCAMLIADNEKIFLDSDCQFAELQQLELAAVAGGMGEVVPI
jgi:hypothetical protein